MNAKRSMNAALTLAVAASAAVADVRPHGLFVDHAVLQRDVPLKVWGTADAGERVTVTLNGATASATADDRGAWRVELPAQPAGGPYTLRIAGKTTVEVNDVLIGEVWLASGQSNMHMPMRENNPWSAGVLDFEKEIAAADHPQIRIFDVGRAFAEQPATDLKGAWAVTTPKAAANFSATSYYFARSLHRTLNVPVGIVHSSVGASSISAWTSRAALESNPLNQLAAFDKRIRDYPAALEKYEATKKPGAKLNDPDRPKDPRTSVSSPTLLFNGMIAPVVGYPIRGAIWYQGESNAFKPDGYAQSMARLVGDWRGRWGQGDFPFYFVQLPGHGARIAEPSDHNWARMREQQALAARQIPNAGMAVTIDVGEAVSHPRDKRSVGERLARVALARTYGQPIEFSGPVFRAMRVAGDEVRVAFDHAEGLKSKGDPLKGFAIAGADQKFAWAEARVEGNEVVLRSAAVSNPVAVRYAWAEDPECNLTNASGLPAVPFRTDDWPMAAEKDAK